MKTCRKHYPVQFEADGVANMIRYLHMVFLLVWTLTRLLRLQNALWQSMFSQEGLSSQVATGP